MYRFVTVLLFFAVCSGFSHIFSKIKQIPAARTTRLLLYKTRKNRFRYKNFSIFNFFFFQRLFVVTTRFTRNDIS